MNIQTNRSAKISILALIALAIITAAASMAGLFSVKAAEPDQMPLNLEGLPLGSDFDYSSPLAVAVDSAGKLAYVAMHTAMRIDVVDIESQNVVRQIQLQDVPLNLTLNAQDDKIFVTRGLDKGSVDIIDTKTGSVLTTLQAGHTPASAVLASDSATLYLCNRFNHEVAAYDLQAESVIKTLAVAREPVAAALTPDQSLLAVAHHLPAQPANEDYVAAAVDLIDTDSFQITESILLPSGSTGVRDIAISPDGNYAYVPHTLGRFGLPTTHVERGWMNTSALSIIDLRTRQLVTAVLLDDPELGAANPWGIRCTDDGRYIIVAHAGTHELSIIDRPAMHEKINQVAAGRRVSEVSTNLANIKNDLGFLGTMRQRLSLPGKGPRGLAVHEDKIFVAQYFSDALAVVQLDAQNRHTVSSIKMGSNDQLSPVRRGEIAFHDATQCFQQWQSCASCHPDARADALNWDLLNDGVGNPKNSRSLLYSHHTPPVMISGIRPQAEVAVRAGFRFIQFTVVDPEVAEAVDEYLKTLNHLPSPYLQQAELSESAQQGKEIFDAAGCASCHSGQYYTDGKLHDVGLGPDNRGIEKFVTPTLLENWRTAPYLYDGRAADMRQVLQRFNPEDKHGKTSELSDQQLENLAEYILSL